MFNLKSFIVENIVNGIKNNTFTKEYGNIMAVNYLAKGIITEDEIIAIDNQIKEWSEETLKTIEELKKAINSTENMTE